MSDPNSQLLRSYFEASIVQRAIANGEFWQALLTDATQALRTYCDPPLPPGITVTAVAEDAHTYYHVIPDPESFRPVNTIGPASINPRESYQTQTNYMLAAQEGDPDTNDQTPEQLQAAVDSAQAADLAAATSSTAAQTEAQRDDLAAELAWAQLQDAGAALQAATFMLDQATSEANNAREALAVEPDNPQIQQVAEQTSTQLAAAQSAFDGANTTATAAQSAYDSARATASSSRDAAMVASDAEVACGRTLDQAQRALFRASFAQDPVEASSTAFNTTIPFFSQASADAVVTAREALSTAKSEAAAAASAANQASRDSVSAAAAAAAAAAVATAAASAAAAAPTNTSLQQAAVAAATQATEAATAAAAAAAQATDAANLAATTAAAAAAADLALAQSMAGQHGARLVVLDEAKDQTLYLVLPYPPHRTVFGGPYSLVFDGWSYARAEAAETLTPQDKLTVEVWMQSAGFDPQRGDVLVAEGNQTRGWLLAVSAGIPQFVVMLNNGESDQKVSVQPANASPLSLNAWHYIVGTYDGTTARLYVDGRVVASASGSGRIVSISPLTLGNQSDLTTSSGFIGMLHEIRLWGDALTPEQIAARRFQTPDSGDTSEDHLLCHYSLDEGAGTSAADTSGNNHDLVLKGASWIATGLSSPT